jgi:hypothetical protein
MDTESVLQALLNIWDDLPALLGTDWPDFSKRLQGILERLRSTEDPGARLSRATELVLSFREYPAAWRHMQEAIVEVSRVWGTPSRGSEEAMALVRKPGFFALVGALLQRRRPKDVTRHTDISCLRRVWVGEPRMVVTVRLKARSAAHSADDEKITLPVGKSVRVCVDAPAFEVLNEREQSVLVLADMDSSPVVFDLHPLTVGESRINFDFFTGTSLIGTASVPVEVTAQQFDTESVPSSGPELRLSRRVSDPDLVLEIAYERLHSQPGLRFTFRRAGDLGGQTFHPVALEGDPAGLAGRLYEQLTKLTSAVDPTAQAVLKASKFLFPDDTDRRLKQLGQNLWRDLIPAEFKRIYAAERKSWSQRSLLILSDEPHLPWELTWPYESGSWEDDQPWCISLRLTRWLRRDEKGNGDEGPPLDINLGALACLAPTDSGLPSAQKERQFLAGLAQQHGILDLSPSEPTRVVVLDLLEVGGYDWLHVAAHGNFYSAFPESDSALWLQDQEPFTPDALVGSRIEGHIKRFRPAFVFNACHSGRQGTALTRLGGWANRLLSNGAGLFLAPLWTVNDDRALDFARTFYGEVLAGKTVAEAVREARLAARRPGDPTWLAYSVYAHPNALVRLESAPPR